MQANADVVVSKYVAVKHRRCHRYKNVMDKSDVILVDFESNLWFGISQLTFVARYLNDKPLPFRRQHFINPNQYF